MNFLAILGIFPAFMLGRISVRWKNHGCAALLSACAGGLLAVGLSVISQRGALTAVGFLLVLCLVCLRWEPLPEPCQWRTEWALRARNLYVWNSIAAVLCGILHQFAAIVLLCAIHGALTRLSGKSPVAAVRLPCLWLALSGIGFLLSPLLSGLIAAGLLCGLCLCIAALHVLPAAQSLCHGWQNAIIAVLFVFLFYYYTNCIY